jgi:hypothetical protein
VKTATILVFALSLLGIATIACGTSVPPTPIPAVQATVNAAIAATSTAQATSAAVRATSIVTPTPTLSATPPAKYAEMSEEELAASIDQAVAEAISATQECSTASTQAAADDVITPSEVDAAQVYVADAEQAIAYAEQLITAYNGLYGELATETLDALQAIEQDLAALDDDVATINATLDEIEKALAQGLALTEATLGKLETAAQTASANIAKVQAQAQGWTGKAQAGIEKRAAAALAVQPTQIATDRQSALQSAFAYLDVVRLAMTDNKITPAELSNIAQLGANASASLNAQGGPRLGRLSGSVNQITGQVARGQLPQAKADLGNLETLLGNRPPMPSRP